MVYYYNELYHHGIKGQKWGVRRFQNADGSYTSKGKERRNGLKSYKQKKKFHLSDKQKRAIKIGAAVALTGLAVYGAYKLSKLNKSETYLVKDILLSDPNNFLNHDGIPSDIFEAVKNVNPSGEPYHCQQNAVVACLKYMGAKNVTTKSGAWSTGPGSIVTKCFKGFDENKVKTPNVKFNTSDDAGNWIIKRLRPVEGSCGTISMPLRSASEGEGHAIMWYMKNGSIKFTDPFARLKSGGAKPVIDASCYFGTLFDSSNPVISRLDNLEIDIDSFKQYFNI